MKTIEELKSMTQEELVSLVQELYETMERDERLYKYACDDRNKFEKKYKLLLSTIENAAAMSKGSDIW